MDVKCVGRRGEVGSVMDLGERERGRKEEEEKR